MRLSEFGALILALTQLVGPTLDSWATKLSYHNGQHRVARDESPFWGAFLFRRQKKESAHTGNGLEREEEATTSSLPIKARLTGS